MAPQAIVHCLVYVSRTSSTFLRVLDPREHSKASWQARIQTISPTIIGVQSFLLLTCALSCQQGGKNETAFQRKLVIDTMKILCFHGSRWCWFWRWWLPYTIRHRLRLAVPGLKNSHEIGMEMTRREGEGKGKGQRVILEALKHRWRC